MRLSDVLLRDTRANQPAPAPANKGWLYFVTDEGVVEQSDGSAWLSYSGSGGGGTAMFPNSFSFYSTGTTITPVAGAGTFLFTASECFAASDAGYTPITSMPPGLALTNALDGMDSDFVATEDSVYFIAAYAVTFAFPDQTLYEFNLGSAAADYMWTERGYLANPAGTDQVNRAGTTLAVLASGQKLRLEFLVHAMATDDPLSMNMAVQITRVA